MRYVQVCVGCGANIDAGRMAVVVTKATSDAASKSSTWHVACFKCCTCQQLLVDLCYCYKAGNVYCERDYAELIRPRCRACDEVSDDLFLAVMSDEKSELMLVRCAIVQVVSVCLR